MTTETWAVAVGAVVGSVICTVIFVDVLRNLRWGKRSGALSANLFWIGCMLLAGSVFGLGMIGWLVLDTVGH